jgi:hypothetical protein
MPNPDVQLLFCRCLHHGVDRMRPGDPVDPPIVASSVYFLPGAPTAGAVEQLRSR